MHIEDHHTLQALQREEHCEKTARRRLHLRTLVLARQGWEAPRIAGAVGLSRRTVQRVVQRYNGRGLAGLDIRKGRGRKPFLTPPSDRRVPGAGRGGAAPRRTGVQLHRPLPPACARR